VTDTYELEIDIAAPRDRIWRALTDPREMEQWFCEHADVSLADKRYDFWGRFTPGVPSRDEGHHEILDVRDESSLRFSWPILGGDTVAEIALDGDSTSTVHVLHTGVPDRREPMQGHMRHVWSGALGVLRCYIERGHPGPRFDYSWPHMGGFTASADIAAPRSAVWSGLLEGWRSERHLRPARGPEEDFGWDVGPVIGVKVLDLVADERYQLQWGTGDDATVLTYTLEDSGGTTRVTMVHSGFAPDQDTQGIQEGFFSGLVELAWNLETDGTWPKPVKPLDTKDFPQSAFTFGVRVLQSAP
jgi:uncharacterized protein YndB with AHSA1/START domain